jgi:hypothetical protein
MITKYIPPLGVKTFLELEDTPSSYSTQGGKGVTVKTTEDGLEFTSLVKTFLDLVDTPSSYSLQRLKIPSVKLDETGLEFIEPGWEIVKCATISSNTDITGLSGDVDWLWKLIVITYSSVNHSHFLRFNYDTSLSYSYYIHEVGLAGGLVEHRIGGELSTNRIELGYTTMRVCQSETLIYANSGKVRILQSKSSQGTDGNNFTVCETIGIWRNTTDNITTINLSVGTIIGGKYWLLRLRK